MACPIIRLSNPTDTGLHASGKQRQYISRYVVSTLVGSCEGKPRVWPFVGQFTDILDYFNRVETSSGYTTVVTVACYMVFGDLPIMWGVQYVHKKLPIFHWLLFVLLSTVHKMWQIPKTHLTKHQAKYIFSSCVLVAGHSHCHWCAFKRN